MKLHITALVLAASLAIASAKAGQVDINTAPASAMIAVGGVTVGGIDAAAAAKIIAGRPYANKRQLLSRGILSKEQYAAVKELIIAKQP